MTQRNVQPKLPLALLLLTGLTQLAVAQTPPTVSGTSSAPVAQPHSVSPAAQHPTLKPALTQNGQTAEPAAKQERGFEIEAGFSTESLSNGYAPWREAFLTVTKHFEPHQTLAFSWLETSRFALRDQAAQISFHQPLNERWATLLELKASPTHRVLPKWSSLIQLERTFTHGWAVQVGWRHSEFNQARTNLMITTLERYFSRWRAAYTLFASSRKGAGISASHLVRGDYYYGERSSIGLGLVRGRELENIVGRGIVVTTVSGVSINGRHWLTDNWGLNYQLTAQQQGNLYIRKGASLGLRYRF